MVATVGCCCCTSPAVGAAEAEDRRGPPSTSKLPREFVGAEGPPTTVVVVGKGTEEVRVRGASGATGWDTASCATRSVWVVGGGIRGVVTPPGARVMTAVVTPAWSLL